MHFRYFVAALSALFLVTFAMLEAQPNETGAIRGTVANAATRAFLQGAAVRVAGTPLVTFTESDGTFYLRNVPVGERSLAIDYTGLDPQTLAVTVTARAETSVEVSLRSDIYKMSEFVVATEREGESFAINEQRRKPVRSGKVTMIPVDMRDWEAHIPFDAPAVVKNLLTRLRAGA